MKEMRYKGHPVSYWREILNDKISSKEKANIICELLLEYDPRYEENYLLRINESNGNVCLINKNKYYGIGDFVIYIKEVVLNVIKSIYPLSNKYSLSLCNDKYSYYHLFNE